jgi:hypothetical protein
MLRNPGAEVVSKISAIRMSGAELVALDSFMVRLSGETLDHGGIQERIEVHVANLLPFVVLKAFALEERAKDKDSYDIVWTLNAFPGGVEGTVQAVAQSPVFGHPDVAKAIGFLRGNFESIADQRNMRALNARVIRKRTCESEALCLRNAGRILPSLGRGATSIRGIRSVPLIRSFPITDTTSHLPDLHHVHPKTVTPRGCAEPRPKAPPRLLTLRRAIWAEPFAQS